jgi:hypothetical protein
MSHGDATRCCRDSTLFFGGVKEICAAHTSLRQRNSPILPLFIVCIQSVTRPKPKANEIRLSSVCSAPQALMVHSLPLWEI